MSTAAVQRTLERFFRDTTTANGPTRVVVAFSGGPDSTVLLVGLVDLAPRLGLEIHAAHLDHALDPGSGHRAEAARRLAESLGVPWVTERLPPPHGPPPDGLEAYARQRRYEFLGRVAERLEADLVATAHHGDDQAETVLLRLRFGTGVVGLAAIRPRRGRLVRPLLGLPRAVVSASLPPGLAPVDDPTNHDLEITRNRIRHLVLPRLEDREPGIAARLTRLARAARGAARRIDELFESRLTPRPVSGEPGVAVPRRAFEELPESLRGLALDFLRRQAGVAYPAGAAARREFLRQLVESRGRGDRVGCDCGGGWRFEAASGVLQLVRGEYSTPEFAYTLEAPGEVEIPELGLRFRFRRGEIASWMFNPHPDRAGLADFRSAGPPIDGHRIEVRNRRPGDRLVPLGSRRQRRLKELLIDRRIPRRQRDRLPLLVIDGRIAWIPGVTIDERYRLKPPGPGNPRRAWIAEIEREKGFEP